MECLTPTTSFDLFIDNYISHLFVVLFCLPTLELTTFEQELYSTKIGYANTLSSQKKERSHLKQRSTHQEKTLCKLYGWLERQQGALHSLF